MSHNNHWPKTKYVVGETFPLGYAQQSVSSTSVALSGIPANARFVVVNTETVGLRWRDDGTAPTATVGMPLDAGATMTYDGNLSALRLIAQSGTATVNVAYYS